MKHLEFTYQIEDIDTIAKNILQAINSKTILFYGPMGSGKTTLTNALLKALKSDDDVSSPTFSIVNEYNIPNDKVYHFDFYRIESLDEAYNFGVEDYLYSNHWLFIEWPDKIEELLPKDATKIEIATITPTKRHLKLITSSE